MLALPFVGAVVGAAAGALARTAGRRFAAPVPVAIAFVAPIVLTGALHLDGFLDGCDAFFASVDPVRRRDILKDPRHGTYALAGLAAYAVLSLAALSTLSPHRLVPTLAFTQALSRAAILPMVRLYPYVPNATPPHLVGRSAAWPIVAWLVVLALVGSYVVPKGAVLVPVATATALGIGRFCSCQLGGGLVGDAYGFAIVIVDVVLVLAIAASRTEV